MITQPGGAAVSLHLRASRRFRASTVGAAVVVLAALLAGCASTHHHDPARAGSGSSTPKTISSPVGAAVTKTRIFAPFDRGGRATAGVVAHRSGSCFTSSITVAASDAYRCFAGNSILDPCFVVPGATTVLDCYADPWSRAVQLRVAHLPAPAASGVSITRPWALELTGGIRCVATNGTPQIVRGVALTYQCPDGAAGPRSASARTPHSVLYQATDGAVRTAAVRVLWRAATG